MGNRPDGFEYSTRGADVVITHHGHIAITLRGQAARRFLADVGDGDGDGDAQQLMARATGNYKHGNERTARSHPRNAGSHDNGG